MHPEARCQAAAGRRIPRGGWAAALIATVLTLVVAPALHADILAGRFGASGTTEANVLSGFDENASGNVAPVFLLGGPATGLETANGLDYDATSRTLLVTDFFGQQVLVFDVLSRGDTAPLRTFSHASMGQPRQAVAIPAHGEIAVVSASFIQYYPLLADGSVAPVRGSTFQPALIDNLSGLAYLPASDEVAVGDYFDTGDGTFAGEVLFFDRTDSGTLTLTRRLAGPATGLGTFVLGLDLDPVRGELYVLVTNADETASIHVFDQDADGDVAPLRSISGPATLMANIGGMDFDAARDEVLVASGAYNSATPRLLVFPRDASGDVAPLREISGPNTGVMGPDGWYSVIGVPLSEIFRDGFE